MNEDSSIFSKEEISSYLSEVKKAIRDKKYTFSSREKNKKRQIFPKKCMKFLFSSS